MPRLSDLRNDLKARGLRMTPQRQLILDAIASLDGHISAEEVHRCVVARFPDVNISTVYRTLELLQSLGLLTHTHFDDGVAQYHLAHEQPHQHLVCRTCGYERELELSVLGPVDERLRRDYGFQADLAHFAIVGICGECVERRKARRGDEPAAGGRR